MTTRLKNLKTVVDEYWKEYQTKDMKAENQKLKATLLEKEAEIQQLKEELRLLKAKQP